MSTTILEVFLPTLLGIYVMLLSLGVDLVPRSPRMVNVVRLSAAGVLIYCGVAFAAPF
ncbi:hypothetical protein [Litoreibacter roseus]|uniref:Uncharacterized protein n=1 Tax=Litoreibacter roseus TaxID=2601869 RepID=A0A6N6JDI6_9RHOB|nr:hypothetical protein [Litoreibacter roseus]GFE64194.1 hypothetical protein KIN_12680 [Litoreibacter roseus]